MAEDRDSFENRLVNLEIKIEHISKILGITSSQKKEYIEPLKKIEPRIEVIQQIKPNDTSEPISILPVLAVVCFGLAGIFIVRLVIEAGWLTPLRQWGLLTSLGFLLMAFGLFVDKVEKSYRSYASAAGVIILYISCFSSFLYFNITTAALAQALAGAVSILCFYLITYYKTETFVIISVVGTYLSPILLSKESDLIFLSGFFLIWAGLYSRAATYLKNRALTLLASYLGLGVFAYLNLSIVDSIDLVNVILVQSIQFMIYAGGVYFYSIKNNDPLSKNEAIAYLPILLFFYGTIYFFLYKYNSLLAPWISLGLAGFIYFLYWRARQAVSNIESQTLVHSFLAVVFFHSGYMELISASSKPWLLPLMLLAILLNKEKENNKEISTAFKVLFFIVGLNEFLALCFHLISSDNFINVLISIFTIFLGFLYYLRSSKSSKLIHNREGLFLSLIHILCILSIYRIAYVGGSLAISTGWGLYSLVILLFGYKSRNEVMAKSSLIVLAVTCLKALLYDAGSAPSGVRIFTLLMTGVILYGAGYLFQKINKWESSN